MLQPRTMKKLMVSGFAAITLGACAGGNRQIIGTDTPAHPGKPPAASGAASSQVSVPPGHMPPKGKCRIWYPGRPPGHQGPIGECADLERRLPRGAVLVRG
jgi:hypothetical protein